MFRTGDTDNSWKCSGEMETSKFNPLTVTDLQLYLRYQTYVHSMLFSM